jgi:flavin reductase (DIM6/NTAB) family NADH-FMN oxidoreductase RutF
MDENGRPTGMTVGSFTSVSLEPPLVAFMPGKSSSTMPKIQAAGRFCANILTADQEDICRQLAIKGGDKFAQLNWETSPHGTPHIAGAIGWIDCTITDIHDAGDHLVVMGAVESLRADHRASPLIFLRGSYGRFASTSLSAPDEADLYRPLRMVDQAWPAMQAVANDLAVECLASAVIADQLVLVGSSLSEGTDSPFHLRLGQRMPFRPPLAMPLIAWRDKGSVDRWIGRSGAGLDQAHLRQMLERVRARGWSLVLRSPEQVRFERAVADMPLNDATRAHTDEVNAAAAALQLDNYADVRGRRPQIRRPHYSRSPRSDRSHGQVTHVDRTTHHRLRTARRRTREDTRITSYRDRGTLTAVL